MQSYIGEAIDGLPDMADFPGHHGIAPDPESSLACPITKYIVLADNGAIGIRLKPKIGLRELVKDTHIDQQAAGWNALHFKKVARRNDRLFSKLSA